MNKVVIRSFRGNVMRVSRSREIFKLDFYIQQIVFIIMRYIAKIEGSAGGVVRRLYEH